ncbi:MAG: alpha/beta hydrolase [Christensenellaceae bacterium]|jgi:pimeloyl-ACP methyl ester carboxylesterase|nr:alpha/beta hydrolase [Christensenellaceae bacterium]
MLFENRGLSLYYEIIGDGARDIIFLHGNGEDSSIFKRIAEQLAKLCFKVYLLDSRGHGKSERVQKLSYYDMACDLLEFIKYLKIQKPLVYGFSDGGIVALLAVIINETFINKILVSGINLNPNGLKLRVRIPMWCKYIFTKNDMLKLMLTQPNIGINDLKKIKAQVVVFLAQHDMVRRGHSNAIVKNVQNSKIVIVNNEKHHTYVLDNDKLLAVIKDYL